MLTKAKSEATTRARTAVENEFITQGVASAASRKCEEYYENYGGQISEMTMEKVKNILGSEFFEKYKSEEVGSNCLVRHLYYKMILWNYYFLNPYT